MSYAPDMIAYPLDSVVSCRRIDVLCPCEMVHPPLGECNRVTLEYLSITKTGASQIIRSGLT